MKTIDEMIVAIIDNEGRTYENVKHDRGGPTKYGITIGRLRTEWGNHVTADSVRLLTEDQAKAIYKNAYYYRPKIDRLPDGIEHVVMDYFTTSGNWAIKSLQRVIGHIVGHCDIDGKIGPQTIRLAYEAVSKIGVERFINMYCDERARFYRAIVASDATQSKFIRGWLNRANRFRVRESTHA